MTEKEISAGMPKAGTEKDCHSTPQTKSTKTFNEIVETLGGLFIRSFFEMMSAFGLAGTLTLILIWFISVNATEEQKREIIDKWFVILDGGDAKTMGIIVILLGVCDVGQWWYYRKKMKLKDEEIRRLQTEKEIWQKTAWKNKKTKKGGKK